MTEEIAWDRLREAVLLMQREPSEEHHAAVRRCERELVEAMEGSPSPAIAA